MPAWVQVLVITAAALAALATIWRKGILPLVRLARAVERIADATPVLIGIAEEFRPNGGSSLRDTVDRIEVKVDAQHQTMTDHLELPTWSGERSEVLAKLAALVERQALMIAAVIDVLRTDDSAMSKAITAALTAGIEEANRPDPHARVD